MSGDDRPRPRLAYASHDGPQPEDRAHRFRHAMLPHMDAAYSYARYLARDPHRAEDIVQDAFLRAFRSFESWRGDGARAWLFAIVRNCFLATLGDQRADPAETATEALLIDPAHPEMIVAAQDEAERLRHTIAGLPQPFRETLILRDLEEMPYKEIALLTDVPIGTVMSRLARARRMLADLILPNHDAAGEDA